MVKRVIIKTLFWTVIWAIIGTISFEFVGTIVGTVIGVIGGVIVGTLSEKIEGDFSGKEIIVEGIFWAVFLPLCWIVFWGFWAISGVTIGESVTTGEISNDEDFVPLLWFFIVIFGVIIGAIVGGIGGMIDKIIFRATAK